MNALLNTFNAGTELTKIGSEELTFTIVTISLDFFDEPQITLEAFDTDGTFIGNETCTAQQLQFDFTPITFA